MYEDRLSDYLDGIDAEWYPEAAGWDGYPPSYDEWSAARLLSGLSAGTFDDYLADIDVPIDASFADIDILGV